MALPLEETPKNPAEEILVAQRRDAAAAASTLYVLAVKAFREFWNGPVPVEDLLARLGTNAGAWFDRHALTVQYLLSIGEPLQPEDYVPPRAYTRNEDGTITLQ